MTRLVVDRRSFLAGSAAASMLLTGTATAQQRAKVKYLTPFGYLIGFGETMYADTGGFFAKEGLDVEIEGGRGSAMSVQQVMGGNVLLSRTGGTDHIKAYAKDSSIVAIGEIFQRDIFHVISHADKPIRSWLGRNRSQSPSRLRPRKLMGRLNSQAQPTPTRWQHMAPSSAFASSTRRVG